MEVLVDGLSHLLELFFGWVLLEPEEVLQNKTISAPISYIGLEVAWVVRRYVLPLHNLILLRLW